MSVAQAVLLFASVAALALANGANDTMKGVATLVSGGTRTQRFAFWLGVGATLIGSLGASWVARDLAHRFSGAGVVDGALLVRPEFRLSVAGAAASVVALATRAGMPVSTTHALLGALVGAGGALSSWGAIGWSTIALSFVAPLVVSPVIAAGLSWLAHRFPVAPAGTRLDRVHVASAGAISFARGLNDTPKIAGILAVSGVDDHALSAAVALVMALGAIVGARRVGVTMAHGIAKLDARPAATANLATSLLVLLASPLGLPVSTTHVAVGSLVGAGAAGGGLLRPMLARVLIAWGVTLPLGAAVAFIAALALRGAP